MKVKEIKVEARFVRNLGNYQSFTPTAGVVVTLDDEDTVEEAYKKAWDIVGKEVEDQLKLFEEDLRARR